MTSVKKSTGSSYKKIIGHISAVLVMSAWGTSFISSRVLMEDGGFTPVEVYVYRFVLAYLILLCFTIRKLWCDNWRDELRLLVCGVCSGSLFYILENYALQNTTTGNVSLLASISPIFTTVLMALVFRTRIGAGAAIGSVVAFVGVGCIIFSSGEGFSIHPLGDLLALSAALSWAVYTIVAKSLFPVYNSFFITRKIFLYGVLTALPLLFIQKEPLHIAELFDLSHPQFLFNFLFLGLVCSLLAFVLWNEVMKSLGTVMSNNYLYLQPLVTLVAAYFFFGEEVTPLGYVGCALIVGGLVMADKLNLSGRHFLHKG